MVVLEHLIQPIFAKDSLNVTAEERKEIKILTRDQSRSAHWHVVRCRRITASTCGKILMQHEPTPALLASVLYSKPFIIPPPPIKWGLDNEL